MRGSSSITAALPPFLSGFLLIIIIFIFIYLFIFRQDTYLN